MPLQYRFERQDNGVWSVVQPYGTSSSYQWTPTATDAGDHAVRVSVRNAGSAADFEDTRTEPMTISGSSGFRETPRSSFFARLRERFSHPRVALSLGVSLGPLVSESSPSPRRHSLYTPELNLLAETATTTAAQPSIEHEYVWFGGQPVAQIASTTGEVTWTFTDHLGTPVLQTDSSAAVVWRAEQDPYGTAYAFRAGATRHQPLRFPGQEYDTAAPERAYNLFRWYRAGWGRYTQGDPIGIDGGINLYNYVSGNPLTGTDPLGLTDRIQLCCRPLNDVYNRNSGHPLRHCYVRMFRGDGSSTARTWSLVRRDGPVPMGIPGVNHLDDLQWRGEKDCGQSVCRTDALFQCLEQRTRAFPVLPYPITPPLLNSNYFARILSGCGIPTPRTANDIDAPGWNAQPRGTRRF